jgi:hypothetical protein
MAATVGGHMQGVADKEAVQKNKGDASILKFFRVCSGVFHSNSLLGNKLKKEILQMS